MDGRGVGTRDGAAVVGWDVGVDVGTAVVGAGVGVKDGTGDGSSVGWLVVGWLVVGCDVGTFASKT